MLLSFGTTNPMMIYVNWHHKKYAGLETSSSSLQRTHACTDNYHWMTLILKKTYKTLWFWSSSVAFVEQLCSMKWIYGHVFTKDIRDNDTCGKCKSHWIYTSVLRLDWVMTQRRSVVIDIIAPKGGLRVLQYCNCLHEPCALTTTVLVSKLKIFHHNIFASRLSLTHRLSTAALEYLMLSFYR